MDIQHLIKQKPYEHIVHVLRRHPLTFLPEFFLFLVLAFIPIVLVLLANATFPIILTNEIPFTIFVLGTSAYYIAILVFFFTQFIDFYLDIWVVTNDRIIDVEQFGLFARTISELDLFRIQDVTTDIHGFFHTLFKFGSVSVKTASDNKSIVFKNVNDPNRIREELISLSHEDKKYHYSSVKDQPEGDS